MCVRGTRRYMNSGAPRDISRLHGYDRTTYNGALRVCVGGGQMYVRSCADTLVCSVKCVFGPVPVVGTGAVVCVFVPVVVFAVGNGGGGALRLRLVLLLLCARVRVCVRECAGSAWRVYERVWDRR